METIQKRLDQEDQFANSKKKSKKGKKNKYDGLSIREKFMTVQTDS